MISTVNFVELDNRVVSATYRNLMFRARVVLVEKTTDTQLPDPVTTITSPMPTGSLRIKLPDTIRPGTYFLMALNVRGNYLSKSADFSVA